MVVTWVYYGLPLKIGHPRISPLPISGTRFLNIGKGPDYFIKLENFRDWKRSNYFAGQVIFFCLATVASRKLISTCPSKANWSK